MPPSWFVRIRVCGKHHPITTRGQSLYTSYLRTVAIGISIIAFILSIVLLAFAEAGYITSAVQDELAFRELAQPRIDFIQNETLTCINIAVRDADIPEISNAWESVSETGWLELQSNSDWVLYALLGDENFNIEFSTVHNEKYNSLKQLASTMCPIDKSMRSEFSYWYNRVHNTPINQWFDYYNPIVIN